MLCSAAADANCLPSLLHVPVWLPTRILPQAAGCLCAGLSSGMLHLCGAVCCKKFY